MKPINRSSFEPEVGMALATKNGQRTGNAFILSKESVPLCREYVAVYYTILTDFGHTLKLLPSTIVDLFDIADWWQEKEDLYIEGNMKCANHRCPKQRVSRQIELLTEVLKELELT